MDLINPGYLQKFTNELVKVRNKPHLKQIGGKKRGVRIGDVVDAMYPRGFLNENEFLYKGKKYDRDFLSVYGRKDKNFKEFFKVFDQRRNLFSSEVKHPVTGEKVKFKDVLEESYGTKNPLDIDLSSI